MHGRLFVVLGAMSLVVLMAAGVAWAAVTQCPNGEGNNCTGTNSADIHSRTAKGEGLNNYEHFSGCDFAC
jgi:hypothetical protein